MSILKKLAIGLASLVILFFAVAFLLPRTAHVERSAVINAPPATVFTVLNGFRQFNQWSPWSDIDPQAKTAFEGPATGVGAKMSGSRNASVGTGSQEILESKPHEFLKVRLTFGDFPGEFAATYTLAPEGPGTKVVWGYDADYGGSAFGRWFGLFSERMLGPDYEKGLARLKKLVESLPKGDFSSLEIETVDTRDEPIVFLSIHAADEPRAIGLGVGVAYSRLSGVLATRKVKQVGAPVAIFRSREGNTLQIDAAVPVNELGASLLTDVQSGHLPAGRALKAVYRGSYLGLPAARQQVLAYLATAGLERGGASWERYVSESLTELYYPIK